MAVEAPARIGELDVVRRIGAGGFGVVYLAHDRRLGRKVALKLAHPGRGDLLREARAAARLAHPNVVTIFEIGDHEGSPYIVMEYVDGPTLRDRLDGDRVPLADALRIARDIAAATAAAHKEGIIHADLTPANVLLASDGRARVVDFGLARGGDLIEIAAIGPVVNPQHSIAAGTPTYMSPEAWRMERLGPPADVWALGTMIHVLVTGEPPVDGTSAILRERVAGAAALELSPALAGVPQDLAVVVRRCLSKDPAARPSAADVASELDKLLGKIDGALQPFRPHAIHCVGRDAVVAQIAALVRSERIVTIVGPAESGKSCATHAVALALRADGWRVAIARPALSTIAGALRSLGSGAVVETMDPDAVATEDEATRWTKSPDRFAADLDDAARAAGKLALVIDPVATVDEATTTALSAAVADDGSAHLVFVAREAAAIPFGDSGRVHALPAPTREELRAMLEQPVSDAGYRFDDGLVDELVTRALREPASALWIQKTGATLWDARDREARVLRRQSRRRKRWPWIAAIALVVAAAITFGVLRSRDNKHVVVVAGQQCAPYFFPKREVLSWFNVKDLQDAIGGVSSDGRSVLTNRRNCMPHPERPVGWSTLVIDKLGDKPVTFDISKLDGMVADDGRATMTGDALTVLAIDETRTKMLGWSRSKRGVNDFQPIAPAELAALAVEPPLRLEFPVISQDGLELFITIRNTDPKADSPRGPFWVYHSVRKRVGEPFPPFTELGDALLNVSIVTGITADRLTLFAGSDYTAAAFIRDTIDSPFRNPNYPTSAPLFPGFRTRPIGDCRQLLATCIGGCNNEDTCLFSP
jgi:serine/threonine-protein kinase